MPFLSHEDAIKQYWEQEKDKYPDITFEQFREICRSPFIAIKKWMADENLPIIMIKSFGKLIAFKTKIQKKLEKNEHWFSVGVITEEVYLERKKYFQWYLGELEKDEKLREAEPLELLDDEED